MKSVLREDKEGAKPCVLFELLEARQTTLIGTVVTICKEPCDPSIPNAKSTPCQPRATIGEKNKCHFSQPNLHTNPHTME